MLADLLQTIPCTLVRGGTSKGIMLLDCDLPENLDEKFSLILKLMGSPDRFKNQVQGLGSGKSTNNKVGIIKQSKLDGIDIEYLFCQVTPELNFVDIRPNCGNFISAVPFFAIYKKLVPYNANGSTTLKILNINTNQVIHATVRTNNQGLITKGTTELNGVVGGFSEIRLEFFNVVGSKTNKLFPTNNKIDIVDGIKCTIIDVSVPMVLIDGDDLKINEHYDIKLLNKKEFLDFIQQLRQKAANLFDFGDVTTSVIPKIAILCSSTKFDIKSYYFDPFNLHDSHAVTGAMCVASACILNGTIASQKANVSVNNGYNKIRIEHVSGSIDTVINYDSTTDKITSASFIRTAAILMDGNAFVY